MNLIKWIDDRSEQFAQISDRIWEYAEIGYHEYQSSKLQADTLEEAGFNVKRGIAEIPTAFMASFGTEEPVIAILGEFDALPGLSQKNISEKDPIQSDANGHGCGHNLLGTAGVAGVMAVKEAIETGEVKGTIRYYGCPAEENGSAKAFMAKAGVFDDVDISLTWHPGMFNGAMAINMLANYKVKFTFTGISAHAAADPHNGRSALDALELMNVGVNFLREHIIPEARLHYAITNAGGSAPNVVQPVAEALYLIRAPQVEQLSGIYERVKDVARGAALMTGTKVDIKFHAGASNMLLNDTIVEILLKKINEVGGPEFSEDEKQFSTELSGTFPPGGGLVSTIAKMLPAEMRVMLTKIKKDSLIEDVLPMFGNGMTMPGSSDVGDVSWVSPTGQFSTACYCVGTPGHSWQQVAQVGMSIGHKGMLVAAKVLALSAVEFMQNEEAVIKAKAEFAAKREGNPYIPPIPDGISPPIQEELDAVQ